MTLGPEMFGLKRISEVNSPIAKGTTSSSSNPITLNRRGIVSYLMTFKPIIFPTLLFCFYSQQELEKKIHYFLMMKQLLISLLTNLLGNQPRSIV